MTFYHLFSLTAGVVGGSSLKMQELIMTMALLCVIYTYLFFLRKFLLTQVLKRRKGKGVGKQF